MQAVQDEKHPNHLQSRKRTFHTLIPALLMRDREPYLAFGSMGGEGQPQAQAALVTRIVDFGYDVQQAIRIAPVADGPHMGHAVPQPVARRTYLGRSRTRAQAARAAGADGHRLERQHEALPRDPRRPRIGAPGRWRRSARRWRCLGLLMLNLHRSLDQRSRPQSVCSAAIEWGFSATKGTRRTGPVALLRSSLRYLLGDPVNDIAITPSDHRRALRCSPGIGAAVHRCYWFLLLDFTGVDHAQAPTGFRDPRALSSPRCSPSAGR